MKRLLNVGGGSKRVEIPPYYEGWQHDLLDVAPVDDDCEYKIPIDDMDVNVPSDMYDGIYCSHTLEHLYLHEVLPALKQFYRVLKDGGLVEIRVPHFKAAVEQYLKHGTLFHSLYLTQTDLPVTVLDVVFGHQYLVRAGGIPMLHKCAFDIPLMAYLLTEAGFVHLQDWSVPEAFELRVTGWKKHKGFETDEDGTLKDLTQHSD